MSTLYLGIGLLVVAAAQLIAFVRTDSPRHVAAQAMVIGELGVMALLNALITDRVAAAVALAVLGVGMLASVVLYLRLVRQWRAEMKQQ